jgi:hypothetical protein
MRIIWIFSQKLPSLKTSQQQDIFEERPTPAIWLANFKKNSVSCDLLDLKRILDHPSAFG